MIDQFNKNPNVIDGFFGNYRWLSNFHECRVEYEGLVYPSTENAYQAAKTTNKLCRETFTMISPKDAKKKGQDLILRSDWEDIKVGVMESVLRSKFSNPKLKIALALTQPRELIEGNYWHDNFWGNCICLRCSDVEGKNMLGKLLMKIRGN